MPQIQKKVKLQTHIYRNFLLNAIVALVVLVTTSAAIYIGALIMAEGLIEEALVHDAIHNIEDRIVSEKEIMEAKLSEVERTMIAYQADHSLFFEGLKSRPIPTTDLFDYHANGVFYKPKDNGGASLYYSSDTQIGNDELKKAYYTEAFDRKFKSTVSNNPLIGQIYINTHDNMNRLYPYMPDAPGQYGPTLYMKDYDFYSLADHTNNPTGKPAWTKAYLDPAGMGWMVSCIVPIYNDGFLEGVTGADITIDLLINHFMKLDMDSVGGILVTDHNGGIIAMNQDIQSLFQVQELTTHEYTDTISETIYKPDNYFVDQLSVNGKQPFVSMIEHGNRMETFNVNNETYHILKSQLSTTGWELFVIAEEESILNEIQGVSEIIWRMMFFELLIIVVLIFIYVFWFKRRAKVISKNISGPIENLSLAVNMVGKQELVLDRESTSNIIEINELHVRFGKMLEELNERTRALIQKETEKKVQEQLAQKYKLEANIDALTGLYNRRRIDDVLNEELKRSHDNDFSLSLVLIDIDNFKLINDQFGHLIGDKVLSDFSTILKTSVNTTDVVGRWGGEEFLVICPYSTGSEAAVLAEKLRVLISNYDFELGKQVTASFGVAQYRENEDRREFFERVDIAMYRAKSLSKNIVVNSEEGLDN